MADVLTRERWERVKSLFSRAVELDADSRRSYLDSACDDDPVVRREVERLIDHHAEDPTFLDKPISAGERIVKSMARLPTVFADGSLVNARFRIVRFIGAGGMGEVYEAIDEGIGVHVALKTIRSEMAIDQEMEAQFRREVQIARKITHPNVCRIHDLFDTRVDDLLGTGSRRIVFLTMELLEGESLAQRLARTDRMTKGQVLSILRDIAKALEAAHGQGVIHRDLKASNVMLVQAADGRERTVLTDFGLACQESRLAVGTKGGGVQGTPEYMAPEQIEGGEITFATDVFAMGVLMYEMITGHRPFDASSTLTGALRRARAAAMPPRAYVPDLDARWESVILRCLENNPVDRFARAPQVLAALESPQRVWGITRRSAIAAGLLGAAGAGGWLWRSHYEGGAPTARISSIAVLPFENLSGDPELGYFAEGLTGDLAPMLTHFRGLRVVAPTPGQLKGLSDLPAIGKRLNVATVLSGAVRKQGSQIEVTAQLTSMRDGMWLWSGSYVEEVGKLPRIRLNLSLAIAGALQPRLPSVELAGMAGPQSEDAEAYNLYLLGKHYASYRTDDGLKKSADYFQQSIARDKKFAPAYAALSDVYSILAGMAGCPPWDYLPKAEQAAQQALSLDSQSAEAHSSLGFNYQRFRWNWAAAEEQFRAAVQLTPGSVVAHYRYGGLHSNLGRHELAFQEVLIARDLDPLSAIVNAGYGAFLYRARRYDEAIAQLQRTLQAFPDFAAALSDIGQVYDTIGKPSDAIAAHRKAVESGGYYFRYAARLGHALARAGNRDEALSIASELEAGLGKTHYSPMSIANLWTGLGDADRAFHWFDLALVQRDPNMATVKVDPVNDPLRGDPRFTKLLEQLRL